MMKDLLNQFTDIYTNYLPPVISEFLSPEDRQNFFRSRYEFLQSRAEQVKISVKKPDPGQFWLAYTTIIEILTPDYPFIVETVLEHLKARGHRTHMIIHPVLQIPRNEKGEALSFDYASQGNDFESCIYIEVSRLDDTESKQIHESLQRNLLELHQTVQDFEAMKTHLLQSMASYEKRILDIHWLADHFIFLGMGQVERKGGRLSSPLGLLRTPSIRKGFEAEVKAAPTGLKINNLNPGEVAFIDSSLAGNVNPGRTMQLVVFASETSFHILFGYFARRAESSPRITIPYLKDMLGNISDSIHAHGTSYSRREMFSHASVIPLEILFTRDPEMLLSWFTLMMNNMYSDEPAVRFYNDDPYGMVWAIATMPVTDGAIRFRPLMEFLEKNQIILTQDIRRQRHRRSILILGLRSDGKSSQEVLDLLNSHRDDLFTSWRSRFRRVVENRAVGDEEIIRLNKRYLSGLTPDHEIHLRPEEAFNDLEILDILEADQGPRVVIQKRNGTEDVIKIHSTTLSILSSLMPVIVNFGFSVTEEYTFPFARPEGDTRYTTAFVVPHPDGADDAYRKRVANVIEAVLNRRATDEPLNSLSINASLNLRELEFVKALVGYTFQVDKSQGRLALSGTLVRYPRFTRSLVNLMHARMGDTSRGDREKVKGDLEDSFAALQSVVDESVCRAFTNITEAIVRSNFLENSREMVMKVQSKMVENMPRPVPLFEIYIYASDLEGIHLRSGMVARGGIRWSDRPEDFRTEILGLMKAQMVKNTLIVPAGSKGGFVLKNRTFADRNDRLEAGKAGYRRFISSLLSLTDNLEPDGSIVPPAGIPRLDGDDPYLVVAADKGTATFSDIANEISTNAGFWLDDAFASGGQFGYDHKKQGITARGAWESVRRLFLELGKDPDTDPIQVVGIGDMGGDVFGNGLIISRSVKLLAAFNHMYIFIDPDPNPERSYAERVRMFQSGENWNGYDSSLISKGGGIFDRGSRKINLSREARNALGIRKSSLSGEELIRSILTAPVDLLWNGGIGTYIKGSGETHYAAGDPSNDRVRVNGAELRCQIVGEGGNLGLTQAGRVEAASNGVRLNTDAIDNSAGVDMSDHEVNLKILLQILRRKGVIKDRNERNRMIRKYEKYMITNVLSHNISNNLALSLDEQRIPGQIPYLREIVRTLVREGYINRESDRMPLESELDAIESAGQGIPRPVLASLMGFIKLRLSEKLHQNPIFDDDWYERYLKEYFPKELSTKHFSHVNAHPLKKEIILTSGLNETINHAGMLFIEMMTLRTSNSPAEIMDAYLRLSEFLGAGNLRQRIPGDHPGATQKLRLDHLILLEKHMGDIVQKVLQEGRPFRFDDQDKKVFADILKGSVPHSQFRPPRESRTWKSLDPETREHTLSAFSEATILADAFDLFLIQRNNKSKKSVQDFFKTMETYRIRELRGMIHTIRPLSSWEEPFISRLHSGLDRLIEELFLNGSDKTEGPLKERIDEIVRNAGTSTITAAAIHEMIESLRDRLKELLV